jgi:hypothetical protein
MGSQGIISINHAIFLYDFVDIKKLMKEDVNKNFHPVNKCDSARQFSMKSQFGESFWKIEIVQAKNA